VVVEILRQKIDARFPLLSVFFVFGAEERGAAVIEHGESFKSSDVAKPTPASVAPAKPTANSPSADPAAESPSGTVGVLIFGVFLLLSQLFLFPNLATPQAHKTHTPNVYPSQPHAGTQTFRCWMGLTSHLAHLKSHQSSAIPSASPTLPTNII
jgi:hypothetical protein